MIMGMATAKEIREGAAVVSVSPGKPTRKSTLPNAARPSTAKSPVKSRKSPTKSMTLKYSSPSGLEAKIREAEEQQINIRSTEKVEVIEHYVKPITSQVKMFEETKVVSEAQEVE
jgi:hypothetical protein